MAMRQVDIQARSVDEAVRLALEQMGRTREQVDVQVLAGTETGSEDDEVLVRVTAREQLSGARAREERNGNVTADVPPAARPAAPPPRPPRPDQYDRPARPDNDRGNRYERPVRSYDRPDRGDRPDRAPRGAAYDLPYSEAAAEPPGVVEIDLALQPLQDGDGRSFATPADAVAPVAAEILQQLLAGMRFQGRIARHEAAAEAEINASDTEPSVVLNISGLSESDQQLLVGRRGEHLTAVQFMVNLLLGAKTDLWARVVVDVDGYRVKRRAALNLLAERMAERVIEQGQPYPLEPMSPYDRRLVHMALAEHPQVMTESTGEGDERRIVIMLRE